MLNGTILVVEDEPIVAMDIQESLERVGYEISAVVSSGEEAVQEAKENPPDLVLMDVRLEGSMDGIEAAAQIRERLEIPVIFLTAYADEKILARAQASESFAYIVKPFVERELHANIQMAIYKHGAEQRINQKLREITALNKLFQKHLQERFTLVESYKELRSRLGGLARVLEEIIYDVDAKPDELRTRLVGLRDVFRDVVAHADSQVLPQIKPLLDVEPN